MKHPRRAVVQTTPSEMQHRYYERREAIMNTFLDGLTSLADVEVRFVAGRTADEEVLKEFTFETSLHPNLYMHLDMEVRALS